MLKLNFRRDILPLLLALCCLACITCMSEAEEKPWDIAGRWLVEGGGYGEYSPIRLQLSLEGHSDLITVDSHDMISKDNELVRVDYKVLTSYTVKLRLDLSRFNVKVWKEDIEETLHTSVPLPEMRPTLNEPFDKIPEVLLDNGLRIKLILDSENSGTVKINGYLDVDGHTAEIKSTSVLWREGTPKPAYEDDKSGCNSGFNSKIGCIGLMMLAFILKFTRHCATKRVS